MGTFANASLPAPLDFEKKWFGFESELASHFCCIRLVNL
jgi:hypothetical protein